MGPSIAKASSKGFGMIAEDHTKLMSFRMATFRDNETHQRLESEWRCIIRRSVAVVLREG